jgi:hypothetical protein
MYFICHTHLVDTFRSLFPDKFTYDGNRAIVFEMAEKPPVEPLMACIAMALTYHLNKKG